MSSFYELPVEIIRKIYDYDNTYRQIYDMSIDYLNFLNILNENNIDTEIEMDYDEIEMDYDEFLNDILH